MLQFKDFPPNFPQSKFLDKRWWHKLIWVVSFILSASALYTMIILPFALFMPLDLGAFVNKLITIPSIPALSPLVFSIQNTHISYQLNITLAKNPLYNNPTLGAFILEGYLLFLLFLPGIIYRLFLNAILGKRWQG